MTLTEHLDALQLRYIAALDALDMPGWLNTFADEKDASYICTSAENHERGFRLAVMMDDSYARLQDRVTYIDKIWAGTFQKYRTRHFAQRLSHRANDDGAIDVYSNFMVAFTPEDTGRSELMVTGSYHDRVRIADDGACYLAKIAIMDTTVIPRYLVYPV